MADNIARSASENAEEHAARGLRFLRAGTARGASSEAERRRIHEAGGAVVFGRLGGSLEPARVSGDWEFKKTQPPLGPLLPNRLQAAESTTTPRLSTRQRSASVTWNWNNCKWSALLEMIRKFRFVGRSPTRSVSAVSAR